MIWKTPLSKDNIRIYAISNYMNSNSTWNDFFSDLRLLTLTIKYLNIKSKHSSSSQREISSKMILNSIIQLGNSFKGESLSRLLFSQSLEESFPLIKSYLYFIHRLPKKIQEVNLENIPFDLNLLNELNNL